MPQGTFWLLTSGYMYRLIILLSHFGIMNIPVFVGLQDKSILADKTREDNCLS